MAGQIGELFVKIGGDLTGLDASLGKAESMVSKAGSSLANIGKVMAVGALAGGAALVGGLVASVKAAADAEAQTAKLNAVLQSTGGVAGMTAGAVNALATSLSQVTPFEDDAIVGAESLLLTFTNIGANVFPQATEAVLNLSAALGQDLQSSAIQVGKALNDPITGATALRRVGVSLTDQQMKQIKAFQESGDLLSAQKIILTELETEFGGAAKAAGSTFGGQLQILQNNLGNVMETIGGAFLPALTQLAKALSTALNSPEAQAAIANFAAWLPAALQSAGDAIAAVLPRIMAIGQAIATAFGGLSTGTNPFAGLAIPPELSGAIQGLMTNLQAFGSWLTDSLAPALAAAFDVIATAAMPTLLQMSEWISSTLLPALQQLGNALGPMLQAGLQGLGSLLTGTLIPAFGQFVAWILGQGLPALGQLAALFSTSLNVGLATAQKLWTAFNDALAQTSRFVTEVLTSLNSIVGTINGPVAGAFAFFHGLIEALIQSLAALAAHIDKVLSLLSQLAGAGGSIPSGPSIIPATQPGQWPTVPGAQQGAHFTVPAGFPNDSFLMGLSSGERVDVTPATAAGVNGAGGGTIYISGNSFYVRSDSDIEAIAREIFRLLQTKAKARAAMGS